LTGLIPKVKWKYTPADKVLHTRAVADGKAFIVDVVMTGFDQMGNDEIVLCIGDTERVVSMMTPFLGDINVSINKSGDRILGFSFFDKDCESYCTAADPSAIDPVPKNIQDVPDFHVEIPLTEEFVDKFKSARNALKDVETFSVGMNKKGAFEIVLGYATSNSNRVRLTPYCLPNKDKISVALTFPMKYLFYAIKANDDIPNGTMSVHNSGLVRLHYKNDKYSCTYYQFCKKKQ
jgi:hypothetical protein